MPETHHLKHEPVEGALNLPVHATLSSGLLLLSTLSFIMLVGFSCKNANEMEPMYTENK